MKRLVLALAAAQIIFFANKESPALDISESGKVQATGGMGLPQSGSNAGEFLPANVWASGALNLCAENFSACVDGAFVIDATRSQSTMQILDYANDDGYFRLRLKEAWADWDGGFWALRVGRQISAWGKADGLQVADVLCAKDETTLIASEYADTRLGVDAVRLSVKNDSFVADAYWIPFFTPSSLPLAKKNPLKKCVIPAYVSEVTKNNFDIPSMSLENSEAALKLAAYFPFADFSVYGFYGHDREPLLTYKLFYDGAGKPQSLGIFGFYKRMFMVGADAAIPIKEIVLRLEAACFPQRHFAAAAAQQIFCGQSSERKNQIVALAGLDWTPSGWTITAQYCLDAICDGAQSLDRKDYVHKMSLSASKSFLQDALEFSFSGLLGLNDFDCMISAKLKYSLNDQLALTLGSDIFINSQYDDLSCAYIKAEWNF